MATVRPVSVINAQLYLLAVNDAYVAVSTKMVASEEKIHTYKNIQ